MNKHSALTRDALTGKGFDRHLFALRDLASRKNGAVPKVFTDEVRCVHVFRSIACVNCLSSGAELCAPEQHRAINEHSSGEAVFSRGACGAACCGMLLVGLTLCGVVRVVSGLLDRIASELATVCGPN